MIWGVYYFCNINQVWVCHKWYLALEEAQVEMAKLALQHGGQWRIVKEE